MRGNLACLILAVLGLGYSIAHFASEPTFPFRGRGWDGFFGVTLFANLIIVILETAALKWRLFGDEGDDDESPGQ